MSQQYMGQWDCIMKLEKWGDALVNSNPPAAYGCFIKACEVLNIVARSILSTLHFIADKSISGQTAFQHLNVYISKAERLKADGVIPAAIDPSQLPNEVPPELLQQQCPNFNNAPNNNQPNGANENKENSELEGFEKQLEDAMASVSGLTWDNVAGLKEAKDALKDAIELPIKFGHMFTGDLHPWSGILLYGPPGTGKSYLAKVVACQIKGSFFSISSSDLVSKWQGESEKMIRSLFSLARKRAPSVIFIDEIDSIATERTEGENEASRRIKTQLLIEMQGVTSNSDISKRVLVLGATNMPWEIDKAARRRFEKRIYIPLPDKEARRVLFENSLKGLYNDVLNNPQNLSRFLDLTEGFSGSDIATMCKEASMQPVKRIQNTKYFLNDQINNMYKPYTPQSINEENDLRARGALKTYEEIEKMNEVLKINDFVTCNDIEYVISKTKRTVSKDDLLRYEQWTREFGMDGASS